MTMEGMPMFKVQWIVVDCLLDLQFSLKVALSYINLLCDTLKPHATCLVLLYCQTAGNDGGIKTIPETGNCQRKCTLSFWRQSDAVSKYLKESMSSCTNNEDWQQPRGCLWRGEVPIFGQTPSQRLASHPHPLSRSHSLSLCLGAAFMPLNKNICHLLLAFWLNAKLNEVDLHISLPASTFKYTDSLFHSRYVSLGMCRIRLSE